jgi:hypothetical protein
MKATSLFFISFFCFLSFSLPTVEGNEVTVVGESGVSFNDALRQAQREAVQRVAGVFIRSETEVENFNVKKDKILSRAEGYITRFKYLEKKKIQDTFFIKIKATVSKDKIKDDLIALKILLESLERPKLMVLIEEESLGFDTKGMRIAETEINSILNKKGFELVDKTQLEAAREKDKQRQALAGDINAAKYLGLMFGAQYVILGKSVVQDAGEVIKGTNLRSIQATLQSKIVNTQTGLLLGSVVKNGVASHISTLTGASMAARKAAESAVEGYIVDAITKSFQDYLNQGIFIKIYVNGVKSFKIYRKVTKAFEPMPKVSSIKKEGWNKASGLLVLNLRYKGTVEELADTLDGRGIGQAKLEVEDLAPSRLDLVLN